MVPPASAFGIGRELKNVSSADALLKRLGGKVTQIIFTKPAPSKREDNRVLPRIMTPAALEEAAQHIAKHFRVLDASTPNSLLKLVGGVVGKAFIRRMLTPYLAKQNFREFARPGPLRQYGIEMHFLQHHMPLEAVTQGNDAGACKFPVKRLRQIVGDPLKQVAQLAFRTVLLLDTGEQTIRRRVGMPALSGHCAAPRKPGDAEVPCRLRTT